LSSEVGVVVRIQRFSLQDGPGIRTTIFLKGCPLRCLWCCNPETQDPQIELMYFKYKCIPNCSKCVLVCNYGAVMKSEDGFITIDRTKCIRCLECVRVCPSGALTVVGELRSVEEVVGEVLKDYEFYITSGGGVTLSGGEPLYQYKFSKAVMKRLKEVNIHTTLDTSGYALWEHFKEVLNYTDLILYDIKHMSPDKHKELTGVDNRLILENAKRCNDLGVSMIIRFPLIPSINDDVENLKELAKFICSELNNVRQLDILPYHTLGIPKYEALGREYLLKNISRPSQENLERVAKVLRNLCPTIRINIII